MNTLKASRTEQCVKGCVFGAGIIKSQVVGLFKIQP